MCACTLILINITMKLTCMKHHFYVKSDNASYKGDHVFVQILFVPMCML